MVIANLLKKMKTEKTGIGNRTMTTDAIIGTEPELAVYRTLIKLGYEGRFEFQSSMMGGRLERGGAVLDFYIPERGLAISVLGEYWHYGNPERVAQDKLQRIMLEGQGIKVVYIDAEDVLRNPTYYVREALEGRDHSIMMRDL